MVRTYDRYAPIYDFLFGAVQRPGCKRMADAVLRLRVESILEVGVGTGLTLEQYPKTAKITGIDLSEDMLQLARERGRRLKDRNIHLALMDAENMDFPDNYFDCVTVPYVLSVTPNPDRLVSEIRRVCKRGGVILIVNHFSGSRFWRPFEWVVRKVADRVGFRSDFSFEQNIIRHGWKVQSVSSVGLWGLYRLVVLKNE